MDWRRLISCGWDRPLMAISGLMLFGSILTRFVNGLIFSLSGDGVYICVGMRVDGGGVSLNVSLFLGEDLVLEFGSRSLDPAPV